MNDRDIEKARIAGGRGEEHPTLFPLSPFSRPSRSPEALCREIGLNWYTALKLYEDGWLSFDPKLVEVLEEWQEAELSFMGALVTAGCDGTLLQHLLSRLRKPYAYRMSRLYYDWLARVWRLRGDLDDLDESFEDWVRELVAWRELDRLEDLRRCVEGAIFQLETNHRALAAAEG